MMIELTEFYKVMRLLDKAYPRFTLDEETIEVYYQVLGDLPQDLLKAAILEYISEDTPWCPSAGQVRARAFALIERREGIPAPGEAWAEVLAKLNYYQPPKCEDFSHPAIYDALVGIGGNRHLSHTPENMLFTSRARFFETYKALLKREREHLQMLPQVREAMERLSADRPPELCEET